MQEESGLAADISTLCEEARGAYSEFDRSFRQENIKRGLRNADGTGVLVGVTRVGSVQGYYVEDGERIPMPGQLFYRGIDVHDIAEHHQREGTFGFEEVAYLLLLGDLPDKTRFEMFDKVLSKARILPDQFFEDVILKVPSPDVMNMLARSVLALYSYDRNPDDLSFENLVRQSVELIGRFPSIVAHSQAVKRHVYGKLSLHIHNPLENLSVAENFLHQVRPDKVYSDAEAKLLDLMLMLHAEHGGGNNSAFVCRALSSTGTDTYSVIAGAIGSLKGPLHGGANAKVTEMLDYLRQSVKDPKDDDEVGFHLDRLLDGEAGDRSGKLYGLGHAVYTMSDPRTILIKKHARDMAVEKGRLEDFLLLDGIERLGIPRIQARKNRSMPLCANVDLYSGLVYGLLGIPQELYTPLFATARIAGWCSHRIEEVRTGGRIMRPGYRALVKKVPYLSMHDRPERGQTLSPGGLQDGRVAR